MLQMPQLTVSTKFTPSASAHARQQKQISNAQCVMLGDTEKHSVLSVALFPPSVCLLALFIDVNMKKQASFFLLTHLDCTLIMLWLSTVGFSCALASNGLKIV